jgi:hypothetical protein
VVGSAVVPTLIANALFLPHHLLRRGESADATSMSRGPANVRDARMPRRPGMAESGLDPIGEARPVAPASAVPVSESKS